LIDLSLAIADSFPEALAEAASSTDTLLGKLLAVPDGPGLGVGLDEAAARANPYLPPQHLAGVRGAADRQGFPGRFTGDV
jgi:hypothetical protein